MAVSFVLKNPKATSSPIYIYVWFRGKRYRHSAEIYVEVSRWNDRTQSVRELRGCAPAKPINDRLKKIKQEAEALCEELMAQAFPPTPEELWTALFRRIDGGVVRKSMTFTEYMEMYAERRASSSLHNTAKQYLTISRQMREFEELHRTKIKFSDVNLKFYEKFKTFMLDKGYSMNYFGSVVKCFKVAYRDARDVDGLHDLHETEKRGFSSVSYEAKTTYLTVEELQRMADVEITCDALRATFDNLEKVSNTCVQRMVDALDLARKKFLLGAFTALRVSDFNNLKNIHIQGDYFRVTTKKTGAAVVIPIHPVIRQMMDEGFDIATPISEQKINKHIKQVARLAGITQVVEGTKLIAQRATVGWYPKCDIITTHTARRSAATNMYKAGIPAISIMKITGHTTEKAFMKYIKITAEENAELMARSAFFGGK